LTAASLIPGGATAELARGSELVVSDSEDDSTVGCLGVVLKIIENRCPITSYFRVTLMIIIYGNQLI